MWTTRCISILLITTIAFLICNLEAASLKHPNQIDTISAENETKGCKTVSGKTCKFPFVWKDKLYKTCTEDEHTGPWCSTRVDGSNVHVTGEWDDCSKSCVKQEMESGNEARSMPLNFANIFERKYFDDDADEATIEEEVNPSSDEEVKNVDIQNENNNEELPESRSAQTFYSSPIANDDISPQLPGKEVPFVPQAKGAFQYLKATSNYNSRFGQTLPQDYQKLIASVKDLCFLVGSCQHYHNGGCSWDFNRHRSFFPAYQSYAPPAINPYTFPSLSLSNEHPQIHSDRRSNRNLIPNEDKETEDYSYFSRTFGNPEDWGKDASEESSYADVQMKRGESNEQVLQGMEKMFQVLSNEVNPKDLGKDASEDASDVDVEVERGGSNEQARQEMEQIFRVLSNEINIPEEFSNNVATAKVKRSIVDMPHQFPMIDPFWGYDHLPTPEYVDDLMFQPDYIVPPLTGFDPQRCNCNCNTSE